VEEHLQFGTFHFSEGKPLPAYLAKKKNKQTAEQLLKAAEEKKARVEELKQTEEGQNLITKGAWKSALAKASGHTVRDDPKLLKKAVKKEQKKKEKSSKAWKERKKEETKVQKDKQKKRSENIKQHLQKKKEKRLGIKDKQKQKRPGFEGRKKDFLNNDSPSKPQQQGPPQ